MKEISSNVIG